jgi:ankyrin repeat protein
MGTSQSRYNKIYLILELLEYSNYLSILDLCQIYNIRNNIPIKLTPFIYKNPDYIFKILDLPEDIILPLLKKILEDFPSENNDTALFLAVKKEYIRTIKLLSVIPNIDFNKGESIRGFTPLWIACRYNKIESIKVLVSIPDIKINKATTYDITPLHIACSMGYLEAVKILISIPGIDINKADLEGITPLFAASWCGHTECVKVLLNKDGIDINYPKNDGTTPMLAAKRNGRNDIIDILNKHQ